MRMVHQQYTWDDIYKACEAIYGEIIYSGRKYDSVFPILRGGILFAGILSERLHIPIVNAINDQEGRKVLIVDDICDSGKTLAPWITAGYDTAVIISRLRPAVKTTYTYEYTDSWVHFPWEGKEETVQDNITRILQSIGENPNRVGIKETPDRVVKMYREIFKGYDVKNKPNLTVFPNGQDGVHVNQMIVDSGTYVSWCEHHMLPFFGEYHFAYIPSNHIIGLSKIARIVDYYASRLQVQERLVANITDELDSALNPVGLALQLKGRHLCKEIRGAKTKGEMVTTELRGAFNAQEVRMEFLHIIGGAK